MKPKEDSLLSKDDPFNIQADIRPLQVVSFQDGRRGHEKQTRGVLDALARLTPITETTRTIGPFHRVRRFQQWLTYCAAQIRPMRPGGEEAYPDLIIGTGSDVHIPMLLLKKRYPGARVVTCMTPDIPLRWWMDLCFIPQHDRCKRRNNMFETIGPPNNLEYSDDHDPGKGLILVGGLDPKSHQWDTDMVLEHVRTILERMPDYRWTISSSPRTPPETLEKLDELAGRFTGVKFFRSQDTPTGWIEAEYRASATVWVTADSVSMVYEALTAGCRVGVLPVCWRRPDNKFQKSLDYLETNRYVTPYSDWCKTGKLVSVEHPLNEATRCAEELLRRWWPNRLP